MELFLVIAGTLLIVAFKSNVLRIHLMVFVYPIWVLYFTKSGVYMPGIISAIGLEYYESYVPAAFWWALIGYYCFLITLWPARKTKPEFKLVLIDERTRLVIVVLTIISAALFMPKAFMLSSNRFNLLPFFAWGALYNVFTVFLLISHKSFKQLSSVCHLVLLLFLMARGERADQIMTFITLFLFAGYSLRKEVTINYKYMAGGGVLFLLVSFIGFIRIIGFQEFVNNFTYFVGLSFYAQQTATDVTHVYISSVLYFFEEPFNPSILVNLPMSILPGLPGGGTTVDNNYIRALMEYVPSYGGGLFYAEAAMNFGVFGVIAYSIFLAVLIRKTVSCNTISKTVVTLVLFTLLFRVHWYGLLYIIKPIYLVVILILVLKILSDPEKYKFSLK